MKKFIIAFALCFACFTLSAQQNIYVIDNVTVENFDGTQLKGKIIKDYHISKQGSGKKAVTVHSITTSPEAVTVYGAAVKRDYDVSNVIQADTLIREKKPKVIITRTDTEGKDPVVIIDGKRYEDTSALMSIDPSQVKSISVFKGEAAIKAYDAPNGVIIVELKKDSDK